MRIAIFGTGGVGAAFGSRLALAGQDVRFLARGKHLDALRENGLSVLTPAGTLRVHPVMATADPTEVGPVDAVVLAVKTWQLPAAAAALGPMLGPETFVVPLQNGVEAAGVVAEAIGAGRVVGGTCGTVSFLEAPGVVRSLGTDDWISFGELDRRPSERTRRLRIALEEAGVRAQIPEDIHTAIWEKFAFLAPLGGVGAVTRVPLGETRSLRQTRDLLESGIREILLLAQTRGIRLGRDLHRKILDRYDVLPADATPSLQRDLMAGRPSELEAINGAVVRLAAESGVDVPTHRFLYAALLPMHRRGMATLESTEVR